MMDKLEKKNAVLGRLALLAMTFIWGTSFVVMKNTLESISTLYLLAVRFSGAALLMMLLGFRERKKLDAGYWKGGILMGLCLFLAYAFQTYGLMRTTPGTNAFLTATYCILVPFLQWLIRGRRPGKYRLLAAVICLTGVGLVSLQGNFTIGLGEGLTVCCGLFYALHIVATNTWVKDRSPVLLTVVQFFTAAVLAWGTALITEPFPQGIPAKAVWSLIYLCVM
jgi:drug/metabolite transporter (DMT)-like permease